MSKNENFTVMVDITLNTTVEIYAKSLEEAIVKARELKVPDVVSFEGDFHNGEIKVTGVF